jgi:putative transposase
MRFQFIDDRRDEFPVTRQCKVLDVSSSGYYAWRKRPVSAREMANQELIEKIKIVHAENRETYGSPRIYQELKDQGMACSENRVARLMRLYHIQAKQTRCYKGTTKRNKTHPVAPNVLQRDFAADRPNQKWLADITYIPTLEGWLYLAAILDLYSRRVVGWAMSDRMTSNLTTSALNMALCQRQPASGLIHHSDQGSQYTDGTYQALLEVHGIQVSMNSVGTWYDNAPMESFIGTLKIEEVYHCVYHTRDEARANLFDYIESFYNRRRRHSALGYLSPEAYEQLYHQQDELCLTPCPQNRGRVADLGSI